MPSREHEVAALDERSLARPMEGFTAAALNAASMVAASKRSIPLAQDAAARCRLHVVLITFVVPQPPLLLLIAFGRSAGRRFVRFRTGLCSCLLYVPEVDVPHRVAVSA